MKKILAMCASALCMGALVVGSLNLWASEPMSEGQLDNVEALDASEFDIYCGGDNGACNVRCVNCGKVYNNSTGNGRASQARGTCPTCGGHIFDLI